jgi:hypothetical protein
MNYLVGRCEDNIKNDPEVVECEGVGWMKVAQGRVQLRLLLTLMDLWVR